MENPGQYAAGCADDIAKGAVVGCACAVALIAILVATAVAFHTLYPGSVS